LSRGYEKEYSEKYFSKYGSLCDAYMVTLTHGVIC
jgi:hypothetical protein